MIHSRLVAALSAVCALSAAAVQGAVKPPSAPQETSTDTMAAAAERGRRLATSACASCHAIGAVGASPMAAATPFREIVRRYPARELEEGFAEGLVTGHPAMPAFAFRASEIDDLIAYLETLEAEP